MLCSIILQLAIETVILRNSEIFNLFILLFVRKFSFLTRTTLIVLLMRILRWTRNRRARVNHFRMIGAQCISFECSEKSRRNDNGGGHVQDHFPIPVFSAIDIEAFQFSSTRSLFNATTQRCLTANVYFCAAWFNCKSLTARKNLFPRCHDGVYPFQTSHSRMHTPYILSTTPDFLHGTDILLCKTVIEF